MHCLGRERALSCMTGGATNTVEASVAHIGAAPPLASNDLTVVALAMLPPPVTGAAKNTQEVLEHIESLGAKTVVINTSSGGTALSRSLSYHLARISRFVRASAQLLGLGLQPGRKRLYFVPDGGQGAWYSLGYAVLARWLFSEVILHHHTFQYIDKETRPIRLLCRVLDRKITHVMLSAGMRDAFFARYGQQPAIVSTNARYVTPRAANKSTDEIVIGHLSNLCGAKGFFEVSDTFEKAIAQGLPMRLLLAGPVVEDEVQTALDALLKRWPDRVEYYGWVSGERKDEFYSRLHVFLFPTHWAQEAQPNVIYEAMGGGAPSIAFKRGCIGEMIPPELGVVVPQDADFAGIAVDYIAGFVPRAQAVEAATRAHLETELHESVVQFKELEQRLMR